MKFRNKFSQNSFLLFLFASLLFGSCKKDSDQVGSGSLRNLRKTSAVTAPLGAYNIINSLPIGHVKDGSRDYTAFIQAALDKYTNIVFPGFPILVNDVGLKVRSNTTITFLDGSVIKLKPTAKGIYNIFYLYHVSNVKLVDPVIVGDRVQHLGTDGEYGTGIVISSSTNITVLNPTVSDCWGDGIHIRQPAGDLIVPQNIVIDNGKFYRNRRNGISLISGINVRITDTYVWGLLAVDGGVRAMSGIDLEPTNSTQELRMINIHRIKTENMGAEGIQIRLKRLYGAQNKFISINISRHEDIGAPLAGLLMEIINLNGTDPAISGYVSIANCVWRKNTRYVTYGLGWMEPKTKVTMSYPKIFDVNDVLKSPFETKQIIQKFMRADADFTLIQ